MNPLRQDTRIQLLLYGLAFGCFFQQSVLLPVLPRFAGDMGASVAVIGVVLSLRFLMPALVAPQLGALISRIGLRLSIIASGLGMFLATGLYLIANNIAILVVAQVLNGALFLVAWIAAQTYATRVPNREFVLGVFATFTAIGMAIAPVLGGLALDLGGYSLAFGLYAAGAVALALNAWAMGDAPSGRPAGRRSGKPRVRARDLLSRPGIQAAFIFSFVCLFAISMRGNVLPILLEERLFSASMVGVVLAAGSLGQAVVRPFTQVLLNRSSLTVTMVAAALLAIAGLTVMPLFYGLLPLVLLAFLHGSGAGLHQSLGLVLLAEETDNDERGYAVGLRATINQFAGAAAPAVAGGVAFLMGLTPAFIVLGILVGAAVFWLHHVLKPVEGRRRIAAANPPAGTGGARTSDDSGDSAVSGAAADVATPVVGSDARDGTGVRDVSEERNGSDSAADASAHPPLATNNGSTPRRSTHGPE